LLNIEHDLTTNLLGPWWRVARSSRRQSFVASRRVAREHSFAATHPSSRATSDSIRRRLGATRARPSAHLRVGDDVRRHVRRALAYARARAHGDDDDATTRSMRVASTPRRS
jgi:hypothetical protein